MKGILKQLLDEMKEKVITNLEIVRRNETIVKNYLSEPESSIKSEVLQNSFTANRIILNDNMDYLELQLKIVNLINKYRQTEIMKLPYNSIIEKDLANIDFFIETIEGRFTFNEYHPYYRDEDFIDRLMAYYLEQEQFEECERVACIKKRILSL